MAQVRDRPSSWRTTPVASGPVRLLLLSSDLSHNALGRAYSLALCADELGWDWEVAGPASGPIWPPLQSTDFAARCHTVGPGPAGLRALEAMMDRTHAVVAVKLLPESYGMALALRRRIRRPTILDMDDDDLTVTIQHLSLRARLGIVHPRHLRTGRHPYQLYYLRRLAVRVPRMTSNPALQGVHGGTLVPHVRPLPPSPPPHVRRQPVVAFVGTPNPHKGLDLLRAAVRDLSDQGYRLRVTANAGGPVPPWEEWVGPTRLEEGQELVSDSDIVAIPSLDRGYGSSQLPVKLIDAMHAGRAVVASDLPPIRWALGDAGILTPPGSVRDLRDALLRLADPAVRSGLGRAARARSSRRFVPAAVAPALRQTTLSAGTRADVIRSEAPARR